MLLFNLLKKKLELEKPSFIYLQKKNPIKNIDFLYTSIKKSKHANHCISL